MNKKEMLFLAVNSIVTSLVVCSIFFRASAALQVNITGAAVPFQIVDPTTGTRTRSSSYIRTNWSDNTFYDTQTSAPWISGRLGGARYIGKAYSAACPSGQAMTGYVWNTAWGGRYALVPQCSNINFVFYHK